MGISGLLPLLKSIHKVTTLKKFAGQTIGIDGYGWLHRGAVACAIELALDKPTTKYIEFAMSRVRMLLDFGVTPYVVFDGDNLPSKAGTNDERRKRREEAKALGLSLYKAGKTSQAYQELQKATSVTPYMARLFIEELKKLDIQYIVAPYEADAQLAYLERKGIINGILSEDSDLLVFGAKRLITKLNQYGECIEIERADFPLCKEISLAGWTDSMFRRMAILSGCDYLPNIEKMGLKTAYRFVRKYKEAEKTIRMISFEGKMSVPPDYADKFKQAELTFIHHRVFCPLQQKMVFLTDLERGMSADEMPYLGNYVEPDIAIGVACGDLNPKNKKPIEVKVANLMRRPLNDTRRQMLATPADLKKKISLDSFFKPYRTPLQELDPNSLTPSPSQQRLLDRYRDASWQPRTVSSAPQLRRAATANVENSDNVQRTAFLARASTISNYQPPKRQRLCSDSYDCSTPKEIKHSPFFSANSSAMSPLQQKRSRIRKSRAEFDVWSDDSVDEVLLGLIEGNGPKTPQKSSDKDPEAGNVVDGQLTQDDVDAVPQSSPFQPSEESQEPQYSREATQSQILDLKDDRPSNTIIVNADDDPEAFEDLLEYHVRMQNEKLCKTFSVQSPHRRDTALQSLSPSIEQVPTTAFVRTEPTPRVFCSEAERDLPDIVSVAPSGFTSHMLRTFTYQSLDTQTTALQSLSNAQTKEEKIVIARTSLAMERNANISNRTHSTRRSSLGGQLLTPRASTTTLRGSEDKLKPESDDEVSSPDAGQKSLVDFQKFVFTG